jgi:hypothetical protein
MWRGYEGPLPTALDRLADAGNVRIDAETWLRVLVPFAAALLLRGPDFEARFVERPVIRDLGRELMEGRPDARPFELQRLLAPVLAAHWFVLHAEGEGYLLTSDEGWAPFLAPIDERVSCVVPIDRRTALALVPSAVRQLLVWDDSIGWAMEPRHVRLPKDLHLAFNEQLTAFATRQVFAPSLDTIEPVKPILSRPSLGPLEPFPFGSLGGRNGPPNEFTWHRLVSVIGKDVTDPELAYFEADWRVVGAGWHPQVIHPFNLPEFPPTLHLQERSIHVRLFRVLKAEPWQWIINNGVVTVRVDGLGS